MLLAIDTAGRQGGVALAAYDGPFAIVRAEVELAGGSYSADLIPAFDLMLRGQESSTRDLSAIAVITGPGSFTGLRIGLSAAKALCEILPLPIVPVTMLELLAAVTGAVHVTALLDASRKEAYLGRFALQDDLVNVEEEVVSPICDLVLQGLVVTPDHALALQTGAVEVPRPRAADLAVYAVRKLAAGLVTSNDELDAHYIRRSDAELYSKPIFGS